MRECCTSASAPVLTWLQISTKDLIPRVEETKCSREESMQGVPDNFQLVATAQAQHMTLLWHRLNHSPNISQNKTTHISSVIPQPCNLRICLWQHSQLCFQKEDEIQGMSKWVGVQWVSSYQGLEMRNQRHQVTQNGAWRRGHPTQP